MFLMGRLYWSILTAVIAGIAAWEFARLVHFCASGQIRYGAFIFVLTGGMGAFVSAEVFNQLAVPVLVTSGLFWIFISPVWLKSRRQLKSHLALALVGIVLLVPTWFALVLIQQQGPWWLLGAVLMVSMADISAYFFGRAFGKRKLAPNISPGKTWEGAWGAMVTVTLICIVATILTGYSHSAVFLLVLLFTVPLLTLLSIAGDLLESMLKRQAGVKDSSSLLPGHGGILDRIDSHTAALPMIALALWLQRGVGG